MATEQIEINGQRIAPLKERLRPGLRAVFVGINPAPPSVDHGHYHQGRLGKTLWRRLKQDGIVVQLPPGLEDDAALLKLSASLISCAGRHPTLKPLDAPSLSKEAHDLAQRLDRHAPDRPPLVFIYNNRRTRTAALLLGRSAYRVLKLPPPFAEPGREHREMQDLQEALNC